MNLANKITIFRVFLVPIFMFVLYSTLPYNTYFAAAIFIIASLTDTLDGYVARSRNMITNFGKFVDPLADKVLVSAALISLVELGKVPGWVVVLIIAREFTITGFRIIAASEGINIAASSLGKIKTITQLVAIIALLLNNFPFSLINLPFDYIMLYISLFFTIISGIDYIYKNKSALKMGIK
ncbi:CDP-diacylglycerol--glycerol-3-phosphate 3-phosphatidyltransferase [Tissierella praeacuta DSM 18095]|uniref:CDP-diacylglycerol--glycerol-3-phosphate 3-phosphatidyltransferase n=1 Tax=Tissierella praeacuta DSM 18095 TaxID=1123404 RepID=A0A1M4SHN8_9FIRM|nr:CDP-diacylglycerol--glycerol-3-phosphate 3-phosphatidyltransferase [Tissierella praeacuta]SHE31753.1 CDP-diacylglycerol--glycerol-3-phosphate 3-phosphatidyltransferase [Tissierella praeacuta DSM 18095]SUP01442.1 CDP-diacylglycerol--glycerol-3-phosphate 3-phosphatidyltransferase [Tissierella praeacuta]